MPGTRMSYSNPGYAIAGYLIEKVTGEKYEDRIAERIFKPSGMPTSSFRLTTEDEARSSEGLSRSHGSAGAVLADLFPAGGQPAHLGARARTLGADPAQLGRDGNRSRHRSRISQQHGASAHDARVGLRDCGTAMAAASPVRRSKDFRCSATAAASTASSRRISIRRRATSVSSSCSTRPIQPRRCGASASSPCAI